MRVASCPYEWLKCNAKHNARHPQWMLPGCKKIGKWAVVGKDQGKDASSFPSLPASRPSSQGENSPSGRSLFQSFPVPWWSNPSKFQFKSGVPASCFIPQIQSHLILFSVILTWSRLSCILIIIINLSLSFLICCSHHTFLPDI